MRLVSAAYWSRTSLVGAKQRLEARHFGDDRREPGRCKVSIVRDQRDVRIARRRRRNTIELSDLAVRPCDVGGPDSCRRHPCRSAGSRPTVWRPCRCWVPRLRLAEHFRRASWRACSYLVLQGDEGAALVSEGLDLVAKLLGRLAELGVAGDLRFCSLDDELGAIGGVAMSTCVFFWPTCVVSVATSLSFSNSVAMRSEISAIASASRSRACLEARGLLVAKLGEVHRPFAIVLRSATRR